MEGRGGGGGEGIKDDIGAEISSLCCVKGSRFITVGGKKAIQIGADGRTIQ